MSEVQASTQPRIVRRMKKYILNLDEFFADIFVDFFIMNTIILFLQETTEE